MSHSNTFCGFGTTVRLAPQTATILRHLVRVGEISSVEAQALYKARSLTKRISEINNYFQVDSEWRRDMTGQRYVRYSMPNVVREGVFEISTNPVPACIPQAQPTLAA